MDAPIGRKAVTKAGIIVPCRNCSGIGSNPNPNNKPSNGSRDEKDSPYVCVMVDDLPPVEFRQISAAEAVTTRSSANLQGIFEPTKRIVLPRRLEAKGGNGELRKIDGNGKIKDEGGAAGAIDRLALHNSARLVDAQSVARNAAGFAVILGDVNRPARGTNLPSYGQAVVILIFRSATPFPTRLTLRGSGCPPARTVSPRALRYDFVIHCVHHVHPEGMV